MGGGTKAKEKESNMTVSLCFRACFPNRFSVRATCCHLGSLGQPWHWSWSVKAKLEQLFTSSIVQPSNSWNLSSLGKPDPALILEHTCRCPRGLGILSRFFVLECISQFSKFSSHHSHTVCAEVMTLANCTSRCTTAQCCMELRYLLLMERTSRGRVKRTPGALEGAAGKSAKEMNSIKHRFVSLLVGFSILCAVILAVCEYLQFKFMQKEDVLKDV